MNWLAYRHFKTLMMPPSVNRRWPPLLASFFIFLFVYAALSKVTTLDSFEAVLATSPLIGKAAAVVAILLPASELGIASLLFIPKCRRLGFFAAFILMGAFSGYILYMLLFVPHLPCSCGGLLQLLSWKQHLVFNLMFTGLAFLGGLLETRQQKKIFLNKAVQVS